MNGWYVIAEDGHDADHHVDAWGEFNCEGDARAFSIDLAADNGWYEIKVEQTTREEVLPRTTDSHIYPAYK